MMAAICIDRKAVCAEHDHNGMTIEYFYQFPRIVQKVHPESDIRKAHRQLWKDNRGLCSYS